LFFVCFNVSMNKIFIPIFKTKQSSEKRAIQNTLDLLVEKRIIPYLEVIKNINDSIPQSYFKILSNTSFFAEPTITEQTIDLFDYSNSIPVLSLVKSVDPTSVNDFISKGHNLKRSIGLRINVGNSSMINKMVTTLNKEDYLFIDIGNNDYSSLLYLSTFKMLHTYECTIIIISDERNDKITGRELYKNYYKKYSDSTYFNHSVIESITNGTFDFDGFGSYCGAKNDLTEGVKISNDVYGYLLIYNHLNNSFYIETTDTSDHISRIYNVLVNTIKSDAVALSLFDSTSRSKALLDGSMTEGKLSVKKKNTIEIVHYIEEVLKL